MLINRKLQFLSWQRFPCGGFIAGQLPSVHTQGDNANKHIPPLLQLVEPKVMNINKLIKLMPK